MLVIKIILLIVAWLISTPVLALTAGYTFGGISGHAKYDVSDIVLFSIAIVLVYFAFPIWLFV